MLETSLHDVRYALRALRRNPGFTAVVLLTLALGIGANTAMFSIVNGVLIKPISFPDPESLVGVWHAAPGVGTAEMPFSPTLFFTYRDENRTFQAIGLFRGGAATVTGLAEPEQVQSLQMTDGTLQALGIQPMLGRSFSREDDTPGTAETAILTHGYWRRRFGGDVSVIGRTILVDSRPREVIGVMPEQFQFLNTNPALLLPQRLDRSRIFLGDFSYRGLARLKPGVTLAQAEADVARMIPIWLKAWPAPPGSRPRHSRTSGSGRPCDRSAAMRWETSATSCGC